MIKKPLKLREAVKDDVPLILSLIKELADYEKHPNSVIATEEDLIKNLFGEKKYAEVIIAEYNESAAGMALYFHNFSTWIGRPGIYLEDLYVKPELRGKGIGKSLLMHIIKLAKERNCGRVEWVVLDWNEPAIQFYKSLGAIPMDEWIVYRMTEEKF